MKTTGLSRVSKDLIIKEIEKELKSKPAFFITQHGTVSGNAMDKLRAKLRKTDSRYLAFKGSLGRKALEKCDLKQVSENMTGACGIAFTSGDIVQSSKTLVDFAKENEGFKIQTGYMDGQVMSLDQIKTLANLPSRTVLLGQLAGVLQAPIRNLAVVLNASIRSLAIVLNAVSKQKEGK